MHYIDLSHPIKSDMPVYPGDLNVSLQQTLTDEHLISDFHGSLHAGTHIDTPMHMRLNDKPISAYPLECFIGNGYLIDAKGETEIGYKKAYDHIQKGDIVLIYSGTDKKYGADDYFLHHPVISEELALFFISRKIKMVGMDFPSPDVAPFNIHKLLLKNELFIIENMTNIQALCDIPSFEVFAQPLKINAEASPVRVFARYE